MGEVEIWVVPRVASVTLLQVEIGRPMLSPEKTWVEVAALSDCFRGDSDVFSCDNETIHTTVLKSCQPPLISSDV